MHDTAGCTTRFSLGARRRRARRGRRTADPPRRAPSRRRASIAARLRARGEAGGALFRSKRARGRLGLSRAREDPEDDVGAEDGVGRAAATRPRPRGEPGPARVHLVELIRLVVLLAVVLPGRRGGEALAPRGIAPAKGNRVYRGARGAVRRGCPREPPTPTPARLAWMVGATLGGARARGSAAACAPAEAEAAAAAAPPDSRRRRRRRRLEQRPAAAPGTPDWSRLVDEVLERRGAGEGGSSVAVGVRRRLRRLRRARGRCGVADFEASSFADPAPAPAAPYK